MLSNEAALRPFECDGLTAYRQAPPCVVLPENLQQVQAVVRLCQQAKVPIVTRGAGTGLSGGALPLADGVLLVLTKLNKILKIDPDNRLAVVEPGVTNARISQAAAPHRLRFTPDPSSQIACTIGGNVAENSGGVHCVKYGLTVNNVMALKIVTVDGELLALGNNSLDAAGYDLTAVLTGSEGMLGIIVEVTVNLLPLPESTCVTLSAFRTVRDASQAVAEIYAAGIVSAGLEMMDQNAIRAVENYLHIGYPMDAAAILLCELDGSTSETEELIESVCKIMHDCRAFKVRRATDLDTQEKLWAGRKAAFPAIGRLTPDYYCMDGTIPRRELASMLTEISRLSQSFKLSVANVFHAGDGNLHPLIMYDSSVPGELEKAEAFGEEILRLSTQAGGTITGEHGVGVEKLNSMCGQFNAVELEQFHNLKKAFDPEGLLNPGKAIPTLRRCAELGRMHVHRGETRHPDLPRF